VAADALQKLIKLVGHGVVAGELAEPVVGALDAIVEDVAETATIDALSSVTEATLRRALQASFRSFEVILCDIEKLRNVFEIVLAAERRSGRRSRSSGNRQRDEVDRPLGTFPAAHEGVGLDARILAHAQEDLVALVVDRVVGALTRFVWSSVAKARRSVGFHGRSRPSEHLVV